MTTKIRNFDMYTADGIMAYLCSSVPSGEVKKLTKMLVEYFVKG